MRVQAIALSAIAWQNPVLPHSTFVGPLTCIKSMRRPAVHDAARWIGSPDE
ncbi:MAG TPA: hypothetical protein VMB71_13230 [Acetobacteraceae bacterium]|nr:hypothetical protein [Acetobacteraceae bacterium]